MNPSSAHNLPPPPLSRTSSALSFSSASEDDASVTSSTATVISATRRTRKRFTNVQLTMLENLFHQNSHPSREDREAVAKAGGMEIKSVTIWFQNKRQTERKTAASNNGQGNTFNEANVQPNITSTIHTFSLHNAAHNTSRTASPPFSISSRSSAHSASASGTYHHTPLSATSTSSTSRPTLDRVASRSELRAAAPRTPSRRHNPSGGQIYDNMPSSPLAAPISPPARDFIDFGKNAKTRRTLEWACAAARLVDKDGYASGMSTNIGVGAAGHHHQYHNGAGSHPASAEASAQLMMMKNRGRSVHRERSHGQLGRSSRRSDGSVRRVDGSSHGNASMDVDGTDSEEDGHEAITPPSTWGKGDTRWTSSSGGEGITSLTTAAAAAASALPKGVDDDDMFKAALTLCGLGRR